MSSVLDKKKEKTSNTPIASIWITWEHQRRSVVLSEEFGATLHELISNQIALLRYPYLSFKSLNLIRSKKPDIVYVQSPSIILSCIAAFYRKICRRFILVVDRHSNFFPISKFQFVDLLLQKLGDFALRNADITIVSNNTLKEIAGLRDGFCVVLPDKLPKLAYKSRHNLDGRFNFLYPCSFSVDEPIFEVIESARLINKDVHIYITGNYKKYRGLEKINIPQNIHFLGFVSDQAYIDYMNSVHAVIALTTWKNTLLCCAYEAVSLGKPIILSDKKELCSYFHKGRVTCDNSPVDIAIATRDVIAGYTHYMQEITELKREISNAWVKDFKKVNNAVYQVLGKKKDF